MSKYRQRGDYHFQEFADTKTTYHKHVVDVLEKAIKFIPRGCNILDVGCGEGLILSLLREEGYDVLGMESDYYATVLAKNHGLGSWVKHETFIGDAKEMDAILFLDSLEHIENWEIVLSKALKSCSIMFIAVPDRHDPHGINQMLGPKIVELMDSVDGWNCVHQENRHARDFYVYDKVQ